MFKFSGSRAITAVALLAVVVPCAWSDPSFTLGSVAIAPDGEGEFPLRFSFSNDQFAGFNASFSLPEGIELIDVTAGEELPTDFRLHQGALNGRITAMAYSADQFFDSDGTLLNFRVRVAGDVPSGMYGLTFEPGTSALSNEPATENVKHLLNNGFILVGNELPPLLSVTPPNLVLPSLEGQTEFLITNDGTGTFDWTLTLDSDWLFLDTAMTGTDDSVVQLSFTENVAGSARSATVLVDAPGAVPAFVEVIVTQLGDDTPLVQVTPSDLSFPTQGGTETLEVRNVGNGVMNWTANVFEGFDWLRITSGDSGVTTFEADEMTIEVDANNTALTRVGMIEVRAPDAPNTPFVVTVTQQARPRLGVSPREQLVTPQESSTSFVINNVGSGTLSWTTEVIEGEDWLTVLSGGSGSDGGELRLGYTEHLGDRAREGTVRISAPGVVGSPFDAKVVQAGIGVPLLRVTPPHYDATSRRGEATYYVENSGLGDMFYDVTVEVGDDWLTVKSGGTGVVNREGIGEPALIASERIDVTKSAQLRPFSHTAQVATNATAHNRIKIQNSSVVEADILVGVDGLPDEVVSVAQNATVIGELSALEEPLNIPEIEVPSVGPSIGDFALSTGVHTADTSMHADTLDLSGDVIIEVSGDVVWVVDHLVAITGGAQIHLMKDSSLSVYAGNHVDIEDDVTINANTGNPHLVSFSLFGQGLGNSTGHTLTLTDNAVVYGRVFSSDKRLHLDGDAQLFGSFKGREALITDRATLWLMSSTPPIGEILVQYSKNLLAVERKAAIRVSAGEVDGSPAYVTLTQDATGLITVTTPDGGERWNRGTTYPIMWTTLPEADEPVKSVSIVLLNGGQVERVITETTENDGVYFWKVDETLEQGLDYQIQIIDSSDATKHDESDWPFAIECPPDPPGNVSAKNDGGAAEVSVTWDSVPEAGEYRVFRAPGRSKANAVPISDWQTELSFVDLLPEKGSVFGCNSSSPETAAVDESGDLEGVTEYSYFVKARNECAESDFAGQATNAVGSKSSWSHTERVLPSRYNEWGERILGLDSAMSIRLSTDEAIDPSSIWGVVTSSDVEELGGYWIAIDDHSGWLTYYPAYEWINGDTVTMTVGARTVSGEVVPSRSTSFVVDAANAELGEVLPQPDYDKGVEYDDEVVLRGLSRVEAIDNVEGAVSPIYQIGPELAFFEPQRVWIPVPATVSPADIEIVYYNSNGDASGWYPAYNVSEWLVVDGEQLLEVDGQSYIGILANHGAIVQLRSSTIQLSEASLLSTNLHRNLGDFLSLFVTLILLLFAANISTSRILPRDRRKE